MKILLVKPAFSRLLGNDVYNTFPIGLSYVASMLKQNGHEVFIYHDDVSNPNRIPPANAVLKDISIALPDEDVLAPLEKVIDNFKPDAIGVSFLTADRMSAVVVAEIARERGIHSVAGGVHPSLLPMDALLFFDAVVVGEGEHPMVEEAFSSDFNGIMTVPFIEDLDAVVPDKSCIIGGERYIPFLYGLIQTQRGCPYNCGFCAAPKFTGRKVRTRNPRKVLEEIRQLGVRTGRIIDDSFGVNRNHGLAICQELVTIDFTWNCDVALQDIDSERIAAWLAGGCDRINVGIESASPRWQKLAGKNIAPGRPEEVARECLDSGLGVVYYFMIGYPGETYDEMSATLDYAELLKNLGAKPCISIVTPYPQTAIWDMVHGTEREWNWSDFVHQSTRMGFADCTEKEWNAAVSRANILN